MYVYTDCMICSRMLQGCYISHYNLQQWAHVIAVNKDLQEGRATSRYLWQNCEERSHKWHNAQLTCISIVLFKLTTLFTITVMSNPPFSLLTWFLKNWKSHPCQRNEDILRILIKLFIFFTGHCTMRLFSWLGDPALWEIKGKGSLLSVWIHCIRMSSYIMIHLCSAVFVSSASFSVFIKAHDSKPPQLLPQKWQKVQWWSITYMSCCPIMPGDREADTLDICMSDDLTFVSHQILALHSM